MSLRKKERKKKERKNLPSSWHGSDVGTSPGSGGILPPAGNGARSPGEFHDAPSVLSPEWDCTVQR